MPPGTESLSRFEPIASENVRVARALLSVSDKTGVVEFARGLADLGIEIGGKVFLRLADDDARQRGARPVAVVRHWP